MQAILTGWKEIALYIGKGVRTVQRWEQDFGLPIRRPVDGSYKSTVLALPGEIDVWARAQSGAERGELQRLRDEVERLQAEVQYFREKVGELMVPRNKSLRAGQQVGYLFDNGQAPSDDVVIGRRMEPRHSAPNSGK